jgi:hypothetical protein
MCSGIRSAGRVRIVTTLLNNVRTLDRTIGLERCVSAADQGVILTLDAAIRSLMLGCV